MTPSHEPRPDLRLTVDLATFAGWRRAVPGLAVPADFEVSGGVREVEVPMPPFIAASFAVHTAAQASICLRTSDAIARAVVCVSVCEDLGAVMVRASSAASPPGDPGGWVQLALLPVTEIVDEVLAWVPDAQDADLTAPPGAALQVEVAAADDAVTRELASWVVRDGRWTALSPDGDGGVGERPVTPDVLRQLITEVLVAVADGVVTDESAGR